MSAALIALAVVLLANPGHRYLAHILGLGSEGLVFIHAIALALATAIVAATPELRRVCAALLLPMRARKAFETAAVAAANIAVPFAIAGATVLWWFALNGEMGLARRLGEAPPADPMQSFGAAGLAISFVVGALLAPIVEELVFRGLLNSALTARLGWLGSLVATSALFAACHAAPASGFVISVMLVAALRRTGSLWAPILVRTAGEIALSPFVLGGFYFVTRGKETGEIELWAIHLALLTALAIALPLYVWMSRPERRGDHRGDHPGREWQVV